MAKSTEAEPKGYVSVPTLARALGMTRGQVLNMLHRGQISGVKVGETSCSRWLVTRASALEKFPQAGI